MAECALRLRNGNPEAFDLFKQRMREHYEDLMEAAVFADSNEVLTAQGRAQAINGVLRTLNECTVEKKPGPLPGFSS